MDEIKSKEKTVNADTSQPVSPPELRAILATLRVMLAMVSAIFGLLAAGMFR